MPEAIVINTGPLIAIAAATDGLDVLRACYAKVVVPLEVEREMLADAGQRFGAAQFLAADWLVRSKTEARISPFLGRSLDPGEASVVQTALDAGLPTVCIDEAVGRRIARLHGLQVTGSIGVLIRAKQEGSRIELADCIARMRERGVWISDRLLAELRRLGHV